MSLDLLRLSADLLVLHTRDQLLGYDFMKPATVREGAAVAGEAADVLVTLNKGKDYCLRPCTMITPSTSLSTGRARARR